MHKERYCQKLFDMSLGNLHKKRRECLSRFVSSNMDIDVTLSVASIGKRLSSKKEVKVKHKIKAADNFIGNKKFLQEQLKIYKGLAEYYWSSYPSLIVLVDWSGACGPDCFTLTASVGCHGRSVPIYSEVHAKSEQEKLSVHNKFLDNLREVIPHDSGVLVITDAGFHRDWFAKVASFGWDFLGRIYSLYQFQIDGDDAWRSAKDVEFPNLGKATKIGKIKLGKTKKSLPGNLYAYKEKLSKKTHKKNPYPTHEKSYSNYYRNGWLLFTSLDLPAKIIVNKYKKRMQIEQNFRDIKNERLGIGLRSNASKTIERISMLFFLAILIIVLLWWVGFMTEMNNEHLGYQANTTKRKRVRSLVSLGALVARHRSDKITWKNLHVYVDILRQQYASLLNENDLECTNI